MDEVSAAVGTTLPELKVSAGNGSGESSCSAIPPLQCPALSVMPKPRDFPLLHPASHLDFTE